MSDETEKPFDKFELMSAILLGLAAVGGAWASYQNDLWGGNQQGKYTESGSANSRATLLAGEASATVNHDQMIDLRAKEYLQNATNAHAKDEALKASDYEVVRYLYCLQMSDEGYKNLKFPEKHLNQPSCMEMTEEEILAGASNILDDKYVDTVYTEAVAKLDEADKLYQEGSDANETGDKFGLDGVIYTVCLFLAGIGLVFKTRMRWSFLMMGSVAFVAATIYLFRIPWAG